MKASPPTVTAAQLRALLGEKHAADVWVPECKNGPTWSNQVLRLDGWAMKRSWAHFSTIGYEIKVSRKDFRRDEKWVRYLEYCHEFYFVCPTGLIRTTEVPKNVGLIWASANGTRLFTKVPAAHREPNAERFAELLSYIVMSRSRIVADMHEANGSRNPDPPDLLEEYRKQVERAEQREQLADLVHAHVRRRFAAQADETALLRAEIQMAKDVRRRIEELGIAWPETKWGPWQLLRQIDALAGRVDPMLRVHAVSTIHALERLVQELDALVSQKAQTTAT